MSADKIYLNPDGTFPLLGGEPLYLTKYDKVYIGEKGFTDACCGASSSGTDPNLGWSTPIWTYPPGKITVEYTFEDSVNCGGNCDENQFGTYNFYIDLDSDMTVEFKVEGDCNGAYDYYNDGAYITAYGTPVRIPLEETEVGGEEAECTTIWQEDTNTILIPEATPSVFGCHVQDTTGFVHDMTMYFTITFVEED